MDYLEKILHWIEAHPIAGGGIVFGVGLLVLYWMGIIGGSGTSADQTNSQAEAITQQNLATAYYAAEAASATAGTQLQLATVQADAATNIAYANDNASVAANAADNQTQQLGYTVGGQVQTTEYNDALDANNTNSQYAYQADVAAGQADNYNTLLGTTIPYELALTGNSNIYGNFAGTNYGLSTNGESPLYYGGTSVPLYDAGGPVYGGGVGGSYGGVGLVGGNPTYFSGNPTTPIVNYPYYTAGGPGTPGYPINAVGTPILADSPSMPIYGPGGTIVGASVAE